MSDVDRYYISQTSGYTGPASGASRYEYEYAVVDMATTYAVALFIASYTTRDRHLFTRRKCEAHSRARRLCKALNAQERGRPLGQREQIEVGRVIHVKHLPEVGEWEEQP